MCLKIPDSEFFKHNNKRFAHCVAGVNRSQYVYSRCSPVVLIRRTMNTHVVSLHIVFNKKDKSGCAYFFTLCQPQCSYCCFSKK